MLELTKQSLLNQYQAALSTLKLCLEQCPDDKWQGHVGNFPFWHVAYHALYYGDFYLSPNAESFQARDFHRQDYNYFDKTPQPPHDPPVVDVPYDRETLLGYADHCHRKATAAMDSETAETLTGPSGFSWYKIPRAEFWIVNQRHVHHHAAQMSLFLRNEAGIGIDWVSSGWRGET